MGMKNCKIPSSDPDIPNEGLGKFVDGYDSRLDSLPAGKLTSFVMLSLLVVTLTTLGIYALVTKPDKVLVYVVMFLLACPFVVYVIVSFVRLFLRRTRVLVYENGFIWETTAKNGRTIKRDVIAFREVDGIAFPRTQHVGDHGYRGTNYQFVVCSKGSEIFKRTGVYYNRNEEEEKGDWEYRSFYAIIDSWTLYGLIRVNSSLVQNGTVCFYDKQGNKIEIGRDQIRVGSRTFQKGYLQYQLNHGVLYLRDRISEDDIGIILNGMMNSQLFLCTLNNLFNLPCPEITDTFNSFCNTPKP